MSCRLLLPLLILLACSLHAYPNGNLDSVVLAHGPASVAVGEDISSLLVNPAALTRILHTELLINFDALYSFNYLAAGHYFRNFGNLAMGFYKDASQGAEAGIIGYGVKILRKRNTLTRNELSLGGNILFINSTNGWETSANPGILFAIRKDRGMFRDFYLAASGAYLLTGSTNRMLSAGTGIHFMLPGWHQLTLASGFSHKLSTGMNAYSGSLEFQLNKTLFISLGAMTHGYNLGWSYKNINDFLYMSLRSDPNEMDKLLFTVTYRRMILGSRKELPARGKTTQSQQKSQIPVSQKAGVKTPPSMEKKNPLLSNPVREITESLLAEQQELLREGMDLYAEELYAKAIEKWRKILELNPSTEYAIQASNYIALVEKETKEMMKK
jgi:tetratricopeptide (TPR) repeat protein